jgi:hypothetical protein
MNAKGLKDVGMKMILMAYKGGCDVNLSPFYDPATKSKHIKMTLPLHYT